MPYFQKFFHVYLDVLRSKIWVNFSEILVLKVLQDETSGFEVRTLDDIHNFDNIGMIELFEYVIFPLDLAGIDGQEHLNRHFFLSFYVFSLKDVRIAPSTYLMRDGIIVQLAGL